MGNHAAFAIARIAKVNRYHAGEDVINNQSAPYPMVTIGSSAIRADKAVAAMFLMTSTFAWIDTPAKQTNINFTDYFTIDKPLFKMTYPSNVNFFEKLFLNFLKRMVEKMDINIRNFLNKHIKSVLNSMFTPDFRKQMNTRFAMALQRLEKNGVLKTEIIPLTGFLKFPSDDYQTDSYLSPEAVKISINYPMHKGGWLYSTFAYWKSASPDNNNLQPVVPARYAMLVEPAKNHLEEYYANPDGSSDIDPDKLKKEAEKRARKIVDDTSDIIDKWEKAVKKRVALQNKYGGFNKAAKHKDYTAAINKERGYWNKILKGIRQYRHIIEAKPDEGGLCGDKSDSAGIFCTNPTPFTKCARHEYSTTRYCKKVSGRIRSIANKYDLYENKYPALIHYVTAYDAHPYHTHGFCDKQYFCKPY